MKQIKRLTGLYCSPPLAWWGPAVHLAPAAHADAVAYLVNATVHPGHNFAPAPIKPSATGTGSATPREGGF